MFILKKGFDSRHKHKKYIRLFPLLKKAVMINNCLKGCFEKSAEQIFDVKFITKTYAVGKIMLNL